MIKGKPGKKGLMGLLLALLLATSATGQEAQKPVYLGQDGEFSLQGSTSAQAIERGIRVAIHEINAAGGVLGGRPLELLTRDNRVNPARGVANLKAFAQIEDFVAVFGGRFSPVVLEMVQESNTHEMIILAPWSSATGIINHGKSPSYAFRLGLHDGIAMPAMIDLARKQGNSRIGLLLWNTLWGRSNLDSANAAIADEGGISIVGVEWYNWGETSFIKYHNSLRDKGAQAILLVANDEASILFQEIAALPKAKRLPIISHWGITGGALVNKAGANVLAGIDLAVIQTFSLYRANPQKVRAVLQVTDALFGISRIEHIESQVGFGQAYDLTHILARAIDLAGTTRRSAVRDAMEQVTNYDGLVRHFKQPFDATHHEALNQEDVFFASYNSKGELVPLPER